MRQEGARARVGCLPGTPDCVDQVSEHWRPLVFCLAQLVEGRDAEVDALAHDLAHRLRRLRSHVAHPRGAVDEELRAILHRLHRQRRRDETNHEEEPREHDDGGEVVIGDEAAPRCVAARGRRQVRP